MNKQRGRISLWLGFIIVSVLFIVAIFGPMVAPQQWIFFAPLTAFMLAVLGFTLIVNAMKKRYEEAYNRTPYV